MPNYDLSSANTGRVANQQVDILRISNQDVWVAQQEITGVRIRPLWTPPHANTPGEYTHGWSFSSTAPVYIPALWWYQPPTGSPSDVITRLYLESNESILVTNTLLASNVTQGAWNRIPFAVPYLCSSSIGYRAAVKVSGEQGYDASGGFPHVAGPITVTGDFYTSGNDYPDTSWGGAHGLDIEWAAA
jgi:hypothetical protein